MGLTGQVATVDELLAGRENIRMVRTFTASGVGTSTRWETNCSNNSRSRTRRTVW